jgi:phytoene dehydrogenase-like protein
VSEESNYVDFDVIIVGSGQNGLTVAAYLATAGKRVLVLERNDELGGGVTSREIAPGFLSERHALIHELNLPNPLYSEDELGLQARYGLEYLHLDPPYSALFDDGTALPFYRDRAATIAEIAEFSPRDADAYDRFMDQARAIGDAVLPSFSAPPLPPAEAAAAMLSRSTGPGMLVESGKSIREVYGDWFQSDRLRIALERRLTEILYTHPEERGTGLIGYTVPALQERWGAAIPKGGGTAFTRALVGCIEDHGGETRHSVAVTKVISRGGRVVGVRTEDGEEIGARDAIVAAFHPHHLERYVDGLDPDLLRRARATKTAPYSGFGVHVALAGPVRAKAGPDLDRSVWNALCTSDFAAMTQSLDDLRRGRLPTLPVVEAGAPSNVDPSRAPQGAAVMHILAISTYNLADGGPSRWDEIKESVADATLSRVRDFFDGVEPDAILAREITSPLDHERHTSSMVAGDVNGLATFGNQIAGLRPTPELSQYAVPGADGLYLTGPFMHPGAGVNGGGRAVAIRMFGDLGLDFSGISQSAAPVHK